MNRPAGSYELSLAERVVLRELMHGARLTVRDVQAIEHRSTHHALTTLRRLRRLGLVDWVPGRSGTLHATVYPVPFGVPA